LLKNSAVRNRLLAASNGEEVYSIIAEEEEQL
jgi:mannitol/fructose-specific phosphotransferase system IIA component (Ntr-type)